MKGKSKMWINISHLLHWWVVIYWHFSDHGITIFMNKQLNLCAQVNAHIKFYAKCKLCLGKWVGLLLGHIIHLITELINSWWNSRRGQGCKSSNIKSCSLTFFNRRFKNPWFYCACCSYYNQDTLDLRTLDFTVLVVLIIIKIPLI